MYLNKYIHIYIYIANKMSYHFQFVFHWLMTNIFSIWLDISPEDFHFLIDELHFLVYD